MPQFLSPEGRALGRAGHRSLMRESGNFWTSCADPELPALMQPISSPTKKTLLGAFPLSQLKSNE